jgi:DNA-binding NtrC family response regulator
MATLLVVDDDNSIRETLCEFLADSHECHSADRAEQALAFLEFEKYDAILTDLSMPGIDGQQLLKRVKQTHPDTPVIIISGNCSTEEQQSSIALGAFAFLAKPFKLEEIENVVNRALASKESSIGIS